jgi:DNA-binding response OmpR family regulator
MQDLKILIVEDDPTNQTILKQLLVKYQLVVTDRGEEALELAGDAPDLIILDINLPGIDGYETCLRLREMDATHTTPIIFLSSYSSLDDRLEAYGAGGNDYVTKPFDLLELKAKIDLYANNIGKQRELGEELESSHGLLMDVQTSSSKLQSINRFTQATLFCHDIEMLYTHFFKAARELDLGCVLQIHSSDGTETRASDGGISKLEHEILEMSANVERIHSFGKDRALFRWGHATLLTRKVGDMIDTLAILMDALEAGIKSVDTEARLLQQVEQLEEQNTLLRNRTSELFKLMNTSLKDAILSLGLVAALDLEDEDYLSDLIDSFSKQIDGELQTLKENNHVISSLIGELRTPPPELLQLMEEIPDDEEDDGVLLF